ncbi:MAG: methyltransferase domain-containing protein [Gammaproteobacteria bacterium]|nr:methyltransferase domain-containing protein [Gammaproteobacteria bacterium]
MVRFDAPAARDTDRSYLDPEIVKQRLLTLSALALDAGNSVLDAGCGTGLLTALMSAQVGQTGQVTGFDQSPHMLELAAKRCDALGNVELYQGDICNLEFNTDSFDAASCIQTLLYIEDVDSALRELYRVLKTGGRLGIIETDWHGLVINGADYALTRKITDAWDATVPSPNLPPRLMPLLRQAGFKAISVQAIPIINASYNKSGYGASMIRYMAKNAVKQEFINQQKADQWTQELQALSEQQSFFFSINRFLFTAVK